MPHLPKASGQLPLVDQQNAMPHAYTEDQLVEQPAIGLFAELGWASFRNATKSRS